MRRRRDFHSTHTNRDDDMTLGVYVNKEFVPPFLNVFNGISPLTPNVLMLVQIFHASQQGALLVCETCKIIIMGLNVAHISEAES